MCKGRIPPGHLLVSTWMMALNKCWILPGLTSHSLNRHQLNTEASRGKLNWQLNLSDYMHTNAYLPHWKRASEHCWKTNVKTMSLVSCLVSSFYSTCHRKEVMMEKKRENFRFSFMTPNKLSHSDLNSGPKEEHGCQQPLHVTSSTLRAS